jgi:hypothetical protein
MRTANNSRDLFMTVGNEIMEAAGALRIPWCEYVNMRPLFERYFRVSAGSSIATLTPISPR